MYIKSMSHVKSERSAIRVIYKNIEIYNAVEVIHDEGHEGVRWIRVPLSVKNELEMGMSEEQASGYTGVELRFVMKSDKVTIRLAQRNPEEHRLHWAHVFYGGIQGTHADHCIYRHLQGEIDEIIITKPDNMDTLKRIAIETKDGWDPEVVRVIFNAGYYRFLDVIGDVEPPKREQTPKKVLMTYGSSITHGSNSLDSSHAWASLLAHRLKMDLRNMGFAGSCAMEPAMVDYLATEGEAGKWDIAVCELGINVADWEEEKIYPRVRNTIEQIAGRNKDKKVYIISPFYCMYDYHGQAHTQRWRHVIEEVVQELQFSNVIYINGLELLGNISLLSADEVHPSIYGCQTIADRLTLRLMNDLSEA
ncbi:MAG: hypothetical protein IJE60_01770 [Tyzzerella sp.]|nr:hypothetical protein [Tyzzerella sp.]